jgi:hypothetical protein
MRKAIVVPLDEREVQELQRILLDRDEKAALEFMEKYIKPAAHKSLDGG